MFLIYAGNTAFVSSHVQISRARADVQPVLLRLTVYAPIFT